jgi:hemerythrin-like metal-binding protein
MIRAGADEVVYPIRLGSEQVAKFIGKQYGIDLEDSTNLAPPNLLGYNLKLVKYFDSKNAPLKNIIDRYNAISVVALKRKSGITIENPGLDTLVERDDSVILLVKEDKKAITSPTSFEKIVWSDDYSVGIQSIDEEHRGLILLINRFGDALFVSKSKKEVAKAFEQLLDYTVNHFRNEEELMEKYNYPEIKQHIQDHHRLTQEVLELNKDKQYVFPDNIIEFLKSWLINHILEVDRRLGEFLVKKGIHER